MNKLITIDDLPKILNTKEAANLLKRTPNTLRKWACLKNGPIEPIKINGRLAWKLSDIHSLLSGN